MIQALLVAVVAFLASIDEQTFGACMMSRPLFTGPIVGLIMGDVTTGIIIGASLEAMFMGSIMVGSAVPPEVYASSVLSIAVAIQSGTGVGTAVALALPLSIFLQMWRNFCYAIPGSWAGKQIEKAVNERNIKKANLLHLTVVPLSIGIPSALLVFVAVAFGADTINTVLNAIPTVVMDGFNVAAGVLSCVGLRLLFEQDKELPLFAISFAGIPRPGFYEIEDMAEEFCKVCKQYNLGNQEKPVILIMEEDHGKSLGQALRRKLKHDCNIEGSILSIDCVKCKSGDYVDIGKPVSRGTVIPIVVKTLIFE